MRAADLGMLSWERLPENEHDAQTPDRETRSGPPLSAPGAQTPDAVVVAFRTSVVAASKP